MAVRWQNGRHGVPARAAVISVLALAIPVGTSVAFPGAGEDIELLVWLLAMVPPFLLAYYRGWRGAAVGFAAVMALLAIAQVVVALLGLETLPLLHLLVIVGIVVVVSGGIGTITELLHRQGEIAYRLALTDELTGLENRRGMQIFLDRQFAAAARGGRTVTVVLFDIDHFKGFNDRFGHRVGDDVLREWGAILRKATRAMDMSARIGGEEFISVLTESPPEGAAIFAGRVAAELARRDFNGASVTVSVGISGYHPVMETPHDLIEAADRALYRAKHDGRNCIRIAGPDGSPAPVAAASP